MLKTLNLVRESALSTAYYSHYYSSMKLNFIICFCSQGPTSSMQSPIQHEGRIDLGGAQPQGKSSQAHHEASLKTAHTPQIGSEISTATQDNGRGTVYSWIPPPSNPGFEPDIMAIEEAKRCAKYANTSLNFNDIDNAVNYLLDAVKLLRGYVDQWVWFVWQMCTPVAVVNIVITGV